MLIFQHRMEGVRMEVKVNSNLIRSERENRGWTQEHLASVTGLSLRTIQRIEKTGSASFESVTALASVLAVDLAKLRASEAEPSRERAIRLSLELPLRLALAAVSGVLCALHFRWRTYNGPDIGFEWFDYGIAGTLFGITVLCPYLRSGHGLIMRALALIGASSLSYFCAIMALNSEGWFSIPFLISFLVASFIGVTMVLVAAKFLIPLRVTTAYWFLGLVASLIGGAAMYAGIEFEFGDTPLGTIVSFCVWHMMACIAIYRGHQSNDVENGLLATFMRTRGRFSIVPGWMKLSLLIPGNVYHGRMKASEDCNGAV
jgi:transcriptional regulator with XRE-family HTH domain